MLPNAELDLDRLNEHADYAQYSWSNTKNYGTVNLGKFTYGKIKN